ncbi:MAG: MFS transporter [Deltaproteobacteria bacterium]|nr:MFS transporter [Deltaproteobacteria bacterium]
MVRRFPLHWAWVVLGTCFVNLFINYSARLGYAVILPEMIKNLSFERADAGSIYNAYLFTYIIITPFTGYLTDRFGARLVITCCALILGLGGLFMGTASGLLTACLYYAIVGLGATGMWTPVITVTQRWFAIHRRGFALGVLSTGYGLGFATMGAVFPWIVQRYNWRFAWYFLGSAALLMVIINALLLRSGPEVEGYQPWGQQNAGKNTKPAIVSYKTVSLGSVFATRTFWFIGISYFLISYALYGVTTFMVDYAKYQLQLPLEKASFLATVHGLGQIVGVLTVLPLSDYLGRKKTIIVSNAMIAVSLMGILVLGYHWGALLFFVGFMAIFYGATFPIYGACAGDYFPRKVMGTIIGAWTPFYGLGAIATHWITGALRDMTGVYRHGFFINIIMAALALFFIRLVRK